jgi:hypothetical protein
VTMKQENYSLGESDIWVEISTRSFSNVDITTNSRGFSVSLVTSQWLEIRGNVVRLSAGTRDLYFLRSSWSCCEAHKHSCSKGIGVSFPGRKANHSIHSPPFSEGVKNEWRFTYAPTYALIALPYYLYVVFCNNPQLSVFR